MVIAGSGLLLLGCQPEPGKGGILSVNKMKVVMWDMMRVDEFAASYLAKDSAINVKKEKELLYQKVYKTHQIDSATFFTSFDYFAKHPNDYRVLLDSIANFGNREREAVYRKSSILPASKNPK